MQRIASERRLLIDLGNTSVKVIEVVSSLEKAAEAKPSSCLNLAWDSSPKLDRSAVQQIALQEPESWESVDQFCWERLPTSTPSISWHIASVNPPALHQLLDRLARTRSRDRIQVLSHRDFPMSINVDFPDRVGLDRLAAAAAAGVLKRLDAGAIVIDAGTATTVDAVSRSGDFLGGAILASAGLMLKSLGAHTRLLPTLRDEETAVAPPSIGRNTEQALRSGAFWGQVGAIQTLVAMQQQTLGSEIDVMLCGGVSALLESHLTPKPMRWPGLVLAGIAIASQTDSSPTQ